MRLRTNLAKQLKILEVTMPKNIFLLLFLSSQGILHQSTCPHTPQQNGIAKRENQHLVETARSLMLNNKVLVHHWGDAVLTACFLINRMSSSLNNKILYSNVFHMNHCIMSPLKFSVVHVLFIMSHPD